ncbi:rolling circle replication-associated protein [Sulfurimonas sp.]
MKNYGLTSFQRDKALEKLYKNIEYMNDNGITMDGKFVPYADFVQNSYNNADRYIAEIQHRAWNMFDYARQNCLENLMFTLTLPTEWHPMKRKYPKSKTDFTMIFNQKFGGRKYITKVNSYKLMNCIVKQNIPFIEPILDFSPIDRYSPRNASKMLSKMLARFYKDRAYTSIPKDLRCYFRVTEPHKDGTPHVHMSLFVPTDKKLRVIKALNRLYPAPLGKIETNIRKPVHYLMKYVLKTFDDLREDKEVSNLTLWYLYHGISRFYTSRTFVSLDIYRKLKGVYDLKELSEAYLRQEVRVYVYPDTNKIALIENEFGTLYVLKPVNWFEKNDFKDRLGEVIFNFCFNGLSIPKSVNLFQKFSFRVKLDDFKPKIQLDSGFESVYKEPKADIPVPVIVDNEEYVFYHGEIYKPKIKPYQMGDFELYNYFKNIDIETVDTRHYIFTRNLLVKRGYLDAEVLKLNAIDELFESEFF